MVNSFIRRSDLDSEMTVVRNEFESGENNPQLVLYGKMLATAYQWHNYGNLPIGARSDIENVDIGRLQAFYRMYYQPDNAVLTVAGKFDPDATLALVVKYFGVVPKPSRALPRHLHRGTGAGRRALGDPAPRGQCEVRRAHVSHGAGRASRLRGHRRARRGDDARARGPPVQGAGRHQEGDLRAVVDPGAGGAREHDVLRAGAGGRSRRAGARYDARHAGRRREESGHRGRGRPRARQGREILRGDDQQSARRSAWRSPRRSRSATGGSSSSSATPTAPSSPRPCSAWRSTISSART